jgi:hypothetical protein
MGGCGQGVKSVIVLFDPILTYPDLYTFVNSLVYVGSGGLLAYNGTSALPKVLKLRVQCIGFVYSFLHSRSSNDTVGKRCTEGIIICIAKSVEAMCTVYRLCLFLPTLESSNNTVS